MCQKSDFPGPWNVRGNGVFAFVRDMDEVIVVRANRIEEWLDRWTPLWRMARMRAIENGRYLVRAANTGITAQMPPYSLMSRVWRRS